MVCGLLEEGGMESSRTGWCVFIQDRVMSSHPGEGGVWSSRERSHPGGMIQSCQVR